MNTAFPSNISLDHIPGEQYLIPWLQSQSTFTVGGKIIKKGRLLLFRRVHYYIQIAILTDKNTRENFEIPIPFKVESHGDEGLLYFDYRISSLNIENIPPIPSKISSSYFNKILEISVVK
tara:strand:- start:1964 stop:2323 length:360 start_codon:yes stop_codon:yes gene_type:complete